MPGYPAGGLRSAGAVLRGLRQAGGWIQADERQVAAGTPGIREELLGLVGDETDKKLYSSDREGM